MLRAVISVWALLLGMALMMLGNGLQGTLLGLRATIEGFEVATTGLIMSAYYIGFMAGSWATPHLVRQVGHIRVFAAFASIASVTVLIHSILILPPAWFAMRLVSGFAIAGLFIIAESWLNHASTNENRGKILSVYTIIAIGGMAVSQLFLNLATPEGSVLFIIVSVLVSLSMVPISITQQATPPIDTPRPVTLRDLYAASPLGFVGAFTTGVAQGAFFSLAAVYATLNGFSVSNTALFLALPMLGAMFLQYPIGAISDRLDRRQVLAGVSLLVALAALANIAASFLDPASQLAAVAVIGGLMIPLYALAISHMNDHLDSDQMLGASAKIMLLYGMGSASGPMLIGALMDGLGMLAFFWSLGAVHLALALFAFYRMTRRGALPAEEQGEFVMVAPRATPVATALAMELGEDGSSAEDGAETIDPTEIP